MNNRHGFLPPIHDLGMAYAAANRESLNASDPLIHGTPAEKVRATWTESTFGPRSDALRDLITTLPAETLADVVVQLGVIVTHLATEAGPGDFEERHREATEHALMRIALGGIMVIAREARVNLNLLELCDVPKLHASRFAGLGGVA